MTAATTNQAREFRGTHTDGRTSEELRELVSHVGAELELAPAEHIIEWAVATFGDRFCITSSMGDAVLAHLAGEGRARHRRGLPRHRLPLRRDHRHPRRRRGDHAGQPADDHARAVGRRAGRRPTARTSTRPTPTCAASCARCSRWSTRLAGYDAWATGLRRAETHNRVIAPGRRLGRPQGQGQGLPAGAVERRRRPALHRRARRAGQPARLRRLPLHRLRALHAAGRSRRRPAQRSLGRHQQDRVRDPSMNHPPHTHRLDTDVEPFHRNTPLRTERRPL